LCCVVRLHAHVCILFCFYLFPSCVSVFATFEQVFRPPLSACLSVRCKLMHHLRAGNSRQCAMCEYVPGCCILFVSLMMLIFGLRDLAPLLWCTVSILRSPWRFVGLVSSKMMCATLSRFSLPLVLWGFIYFVTLLFMLSQF
jgi:hypothetical protein